MIFLATHCKVLQYALPRPFMEEADLAGKDRHRGSGHPLAPATPPDIRVRIRQFENRLTCRSGSTRSPFQAQGEISPGKNALLHCTTAGSTPPRLWSQELCGHVPARPARKRLLSGSCSSARSFASRFLPTLGRPHAVALRFARCDLLTTGLTPVRVRPCWAHTQKSPALSRALLLALRCLL